MSSKIPFFSSNLLLNNLRLNCFVFDAMLRLPRTYSYAMDAWGPTTTARLCSGPRIPVTLRLSKTLQMFVKYKPNLFDKNMSDQARSNPSQELPNLLCLSSVKLVSCLERAIANQITKILIPSNVCGSCRTNANTNSEEHSTPIMTPI